jgi:hypothetical protein
MLQAAAAHASPAEFCHHARMPCLPRWYGSEVAGEFYGINAEELSGGLTWLRAQVLGEGNCREVSERPDAQLACPVVPGQRAALVR